MTFAISKKSLIRVFLILPLFVVMTAQSDELVSQELKVEQLTFRYNSDDASIWEPCTIEKSKQTHDFIAKCGKYRFTAHILLRVWGPTHGASVDENTYDIFVIIDRHEANGALTTSINSTVITVESGTGIKALTSDVSFNDGIYNFQTKIKLK